METKFDKFEHHINTYLIQSGGWFNKNMSYYQYRKSHCGDKTILRPSYLHYGISYTGKMTTLYWIRAQVSLWHDICSRKWMPYSLSAISSIVPIGLNFTKIPAERSLFTLKKLIWKCSLQNAAHLVPRPMLYSTMTIMDPAVVLK